MVGGEECKCVEMMTVKIHDANEYTDGIGVVAEKLNS